MTVCSSYRYALPYPQRVSSAAHHALPIDAATLSSVLLALEGHTLDDIAGLSHPQPSAIARSANVVINPVLAGALEEEGQNTLPNRTCSGLLLCLIHGPALVAEERICIWQNTSHRDMP